MALSLFHVDSFTERPFAGNPAAVCLLDAERDASWMQRVAAELRLSETAFLLPGQDAWSLRWFTPEVEVPLCGHGTLAAAHVLWESGRLPRESAALFDTRSGRLRAEWRSGEIRLDLPARPAREVRLEGLAEALGAELLFVGLTEANDALAVVRDAHTVRALRPDLGAVRRLEAQGVMVTAPSDTTEFDFVSRFFAPKEGIDEDPVTGSAHCALGPFWAQRLGRTELRAFQASARGGALTVQVRGERVFVGGRALTISRGDLLA